MKAGEKVVKDLIQFCDSYTIFLNKLKSLVLAGKIKLYKQEYVEEIFTNQVEIARELKALVGQLSSNLTPNTLQEILASLSLGNLDVLRDAKRIPRDLATIQKNLLSQRVGASKSVMNLLYAIAPEQRPTQYKLREKFKIGGVSIDITIQNCWVPESSLDLLEQNRLQLEKVCPKDHLLIRALNNPKFLVEASARYILEVTIDALKRNPWLSMSSRLTIYLLMGGGCARILNAFSAYLLEVPSMTSEEMAEWIEVSKGNKRLEDTSYFKTIIHELGHMRDFYNYERYDVSARDFGRVIKLKTNQLEKYSELLANLRSEGYATFVQWINSSLIENALFLSPQLSYQTSKDRKFSTIADLLAIPGRFKAVFYDTNSFADQYYKVEHWCSIDYEYSLGGLTFAHMFVYYLREFSNTELFVISSDHLLTPGGVIEFLKSKFNGPDAVGQFWQQDPAARQRLLAEKYAILPYKEVVSRRDINYMILASPLLRPRIDTLFKMLQMPIAIFYKQGLKIYSHYGTQDHMFWEFADLKKIQKSAIQKDRALLKESGM